MGGHEHTRSYESQSRWESGAARVSKKLRPRLESYIEGKVNNFLIDIVGEENLDPLVHQSHVVVANHPIPNDFVSNTIGISPDSLILHSVIKRYTDKELHFLGQYGEGAAPFLKYFPRRLQEKWKQAHKGVMKGLDIVTLDTTPGAIPLDFVKGAERIFLEGNPLLIYPYGETWHEDEALKDRVQRGAAYIARKFGVPILPVYITGAKTWQKGERSKVVVGQSFTTIDMSEQEVGRRIQQDILSLRENQSVSRT